ncbi:MAG TPA: FkbM family methyltransferase [Thermoleophilaceae bacterium]|nr:FkbM family methyltransferase [Thermoleophilaceae bacterium]
MPKLGVQPMDSLAALGTDYGSYVVPVDLIGGDWLCYCIGTGADISFELGLLDAGVARIRSFEAVENLADYAREQAAGRPSLSVEHAAMALEDGPVRMQVSHVPVSQSVSAAGLYDGDNYVEVPGRTLRSLMEENGDQRIDLLKLDVEGLEYKLLPQLDLRALGVQVLCAQFHHIATVRGAKRLIAELRGKGYELVACHPTVKLTFAARELL